MHGSSAQCPLPPSRTGVDDLLDLELLWPKGVTGRGVVSAFRGRPRRRTHSVRVYASSPENNELRCGVVSTAGRR
jgi:hypothetical protein